MTDETPLTHLRTTADEREAEAIRLALEAADVPVEMIWSEAPEGGSAWEIFVPADQATRAEAICRAGRWPRRA